MVLANENNPLLQGHAPGGRSGPNHCQECSERWPCNWAILCDMYAAAEATGRAAVRALDRLYPAIATRVIVLEQSGEEKAAAAWNEEAKMVAAVLATDTARAWLEQQEKENG